MSGMQERLWHRAYDVEAMLLPQSDRAVVGGNDQVELHPPKAHPDRDLLRMDAHLRSDAATPRRFADDVAAVADVVAWSGLVRFDVVGAGDVAVFVHGHKGRGGAADPQRVGVLFRDGRIDSVGLTGAEDRFEDGPDTGPVRWLKRADGVHNG